MKGSEIYARIKKYFNTGEDRSKKAKRHISLSLIYRFGDILLGFILVPLILKYITNEEYGIWLILYSITSMLRFMDVGLDGGLRNKFAVCLAENKNEDARHYLSTAFVALSIISISVLSIFLIINPFLDWVKILNTNYLYQNTVSWLVLLTFISFSLTLLLKIITTILLADQKPSFINLNNFLIKVFEIGILLFLLNTTEGSLLKLGVILSVVPVLILLIFNIYFFSTSYRKFIPSFKYVKMKYLKDIMNLGIKFFIIRIAVVVLFATDNIIITQLFGPSEVTVYQIAHKYFGVPLMIFLIFVQTIWSAVTEAYCKEDFIWIKRAVNKMVKLWLILVVIIIIMILCSSFVFDIWLQGKIIIPISLSIGWSAFVILQTFNSIFVNVINGIGKVKIQLYTAINTMIINIPLSIFFARTLNMGTVGVIYATSVSITISIVLRLIQYKKIMNRTAKGVWNE